MDLTPVEVETLRWIAAGKTLMEISVIREISEQTVKKQAAALREKLGAMTSAHAVSIAIGKGIIEAQNA